MLRRAFLYFVISLTWHVTSNLACPNGLCFCRSNIEGKYYYSRKEADKNTNRTRDLCIYAALVFAVLTFGLSRAFLFFRVALESSKRLHGKMFSAIIRAPMYFFDTNSIGRNALYRF